jgi:uncharacterized protein (TIGR02452 family)
MASYKKPGGGVLNGTKAQEEQICRRTNLYDTLNSIVYPLDLTQYIYSSNVSIIRAANFNFINPLLINVISVAAIKIEDINLTEEEYINLMELKIRQTLMPALIDGNNKNLVLSAFGCGAYGNDPEIVSKLYAKILPEYKHLYDSIYFVIYNDNNAKKDNLGIFQKNILEN